MERDCYGDGGCDRLCPTEIINPLETSLQNKNKGVITGLVDTRVNRSKESNGSPRAIHRKRQPYKIEYGDGTEEAVHSVPSTEYLSCLSSSLDDLAVNKHLNIPFSDRDVPIDVDLTLSPRSNFRYVSVNSKKLQGQHLFDHENDCKRKQVAKWLDHHYNSEFIRDRSRIKRKMISRKDKKRVHTKSPKRSSNTSLPSKWTSLWRDGESLEGSSDVDLHKTPSTLPSSLLSCDNRKHKSLTSRESGKLFTKSRQWSSSSLFSRRASLWRDDASSEGSSEADSCNVLGSDTSLSSDALSMPNSRSKFYRFTYISPSSSIDNDSNFCKETAVQQRDEDGGIHYQSDSRVFNYLTNHVSGSTRFGSTANGNVSVVKVFSVSKPIDRHIRSRIPILRKPVDGRVHSMATMGNSSWAVYQAGREITFEFWRKFNRDQRRSKIPVRKPSNLDAISSFAIKRLKGFVLQQSEKETILQYWRKWNRRHSESIVGGKSRRLKSLIPVRRKGQGKTENAESLPAGCERKRMSLLPFKSKSKIPVRRKEKLKTEYKHDPSMYVLLAKSIVESAVECAKKIVMSDFVNTNSAKKKLKNVRFKARGQQMEYSLNGLDSKTEININYEKIHRSKKYPQTHYPKTKSGPVLSERRTHEDDSSYAAVEANRSLKRDNKRDYEKPKVDNIDKVVIKPKPVHRGVSDEVEQYKCTEGIDVTKLPLEHDTKGYTAFKAVSKATELLNTGIIEKRACQSQRHKTRYTIDGRFGKSESRPAKRKEHDKPMETALKHNGCSERDETNSSADFRKYLFVKRDRKIETPTKNIFSERDETDKQSDILIRSRVKRNDHVSYRATASSLSGQPNRYTRKQSRSVDGN